MRRQTSQLKLCQLAALCCGGSEAGDTVRTTVRFAAPPEAVWDSLMTYEEVPERPPGWMRWLLPEPLGTSGDKTSPGAMLPCRYATGDLTKRILTSRAPWKLEFEVLEQRLGTEGCFEARRGSYEIRPLGAESEIELTTHYAARLHPRWLWRPFEHWLGHRFHEHLLRAMARRCNGTRAERAAA